jgi:hypothetical protein
MRASRLLALLTNYSLAPGRKVQSPCADIRNSPVWVGSREQVLNRLAQRGKALRHELRVHGGRTVCHFQPAQLD